MVIQVGAEKDSEMGESIGGGVFHVTSSYSFLSEGGDNRDAISYSRQRRGTHLLILLFDQTLSMLLCLAIYLGAIDHGLWNHTNLGSSLVSLIYYPMTWETLECF